MNIYNMSNSSMLQSWQAKKPKQKQKSYILNKNKFKAKTIMSWSWVGARAAAKAGKSLYQTKSIITFFASFCTTIFNANIQHHLILTTPTERA